MSAGVRADRERGRPWAWCGRFTAGVVAVALALIRCAGPSSTSGFDVQGTLDPLHPRAIRVPSAESAKPPAAVRLEVPVASAVWVSLKCRGEGGDVWIQGVLKDLRGPEVVHRFDVRADGGVLKVPRADPGVSYVLVLVNRAPADVICVPTTRVVPGTSLPASTRPLDANGEAEGVLFPWPGLERQSYHIAVERPTHLRLEAVGDLEEGAVRLTFRHENRSPVSAPRALDLPLVEPGIHELEVSLDGESQPVRFRVFGTASPTCRPEPVTLWNRRWARFSLSPDDPCRRVFVGRIRIDHATPLAIDLRSEALASLDVRYRAPERPWLDVGTGARDLPRVTTFGWHEVEIRLKDTLGAEHGPGRLEMVEGSVRLSFQSPCASLRGRVYDVRGSFVVVDLHRWQGLRAGMRGVLKREGRVVGRVEVVGASGKNAVLKVLDSTVPVQVGFQVIFPCR